MSGLSPLRPCLLVSRLPSSLYSSLTEYLSSSRGNRRPFQTSLQVPPLLSPVSWLYTNPFPSHRLTSWGSYTSYQTLQGASLFPPSKCPFPSSFAVSQCSFLPARPSSKSDYHPFCPATLSRNPHTTIYSCFLLFPVLVGFFLSALGFLPLYEYFRTRVRLRLFLARYLTCVPRSAFYSIERLLSFDSLYRMSLASPIRCSVPPARGFHSL